MIAITQIEKSIEEVCELFNISLCIHKLDGSVVYCFNLNENAEISTIKTLGNFKTYPEEFQKIFKADQNNIVFGKCCSGIDAAAMPFIINKKKAGVIIITDFFILEEKISEDKLVEANRNAEKIKREEILYYIRSLPTFTKEKTRKIASFIISHIEAILGKNDFEHSFAYERDREDEIKLLLDKLGDTDNRLTDLYKKLAASERKFHQLFTGMINAFTVNEIICDEYLNPFDYTILEVNPAFERLSDLKSEKILRRRASEVFYKKRLTWVDKFGESALYGTTAHLEGYFEPLDKVLEVYVFSPKANMFAAIYNDITDRKRAEILLQKSEEKYRTIFETAANIIVSIKSNGRIIECNTQVEKTLEYTKAEIEGKYIYDFIFEDDILKFKKAIGEVFSNGYSTYKELSLVSKNGKLIDVAANAKILKTNEGEEELSLCIFNDITDQKNTLRLLNKQNTYLSQISDSALQLVEFKPDGDIFSLVGSQLQKLFGKKAYILISTYEEYTNEVVLKSIIGTEKFYKKIIQLFSRDPIGARVVLGEEAYGQAISGKLNHIEEGLYEVSQKALLRTICDPIEKLLNIRSVYGIGFTQEGKLLGAAVILSMEENLSVDEKVIETFIHQASVAIYRKLTDDALLESEKKFRTIFNNAFIGMVLASPKGDIILANRAFEKITGYSFDELRNKNFRDITHEEDVGEETYLINKARKEGQEGIAIEKRYLRKDGSYVWVKLTIQYKRRKDGNVDYIIALTEDITKEKKAKKALMESEQKYREFAEMLPQAVYEIDAQGKFVFVNKAAFELFEYTQDDYKKGIFVEQVLQGEDYSRMQMKIENFQEFRNRIDEYIAITKSGRKLTVLPYNVPNIKDDKIIGFRGILIDITEQKLADSLIRDKERRLRFIMDNIMDVLWTMDSNLWLNFVSPSVYLFLGYDSDEIKQKSIRQLLAKESFIRTSRFIKTKLNRLKTGAEVLTEEDIFQFELTFIHKFGHKIKGDTIGRFVFNASAKDNIEIHGVIRDVTERKKNEELEKKVEISRKGAEMKQQFLANMSHEIRTPMTGIIGMIEFIQNTNLDSEQKEYINTIKNSAESLLNILNDILVLSKIEAGKLEIIPEVFNFRESVKDIYSLFESLIKQKELSFEINISDYIPEFISADKNRIKQVISNLVSNAIKFTELGRISVNFHLVKESEDEITIKTVIEDTGIGISSDDQRNLFESFAQVDASYTKNYQGIGLGLTICKQLTELMGGEIGVDSELGKGSRFYFTFTAMKTEDPLEEKPIEEEVVKERINCHILLVEDKVVNQKVISMMLESVGCSVITAKNGKEALELFDVGIFDIVLMDIQMPVMDGVTAMKELRRKYMDEAPPIIALSANAMEGDAEKFIGEGMDDYLTKPVNKEQLYRKINAWTRRKK